MTSLRELQRHNDPSPHHIHQLNPSLTLAPDGFNEYLTKQKPNSHKVDLNKPITKKEYMHLIRFMKKQDSKMLMLMTGLIFAQMLTILVLMRKSN